MVAILLLILKIIGILLLVLLGLALVLVLLLLFYPLRYRLTGDIPDMEHRRICLRVRWMLCIARFTLLLDETNEPQMCLRFLGIPVWRSPGKKQEKKRDKKRVKKRKNEPDISPDEDWFKESNIEKAEIFDKGLEDHLIEVSDSYDEPIGDGNININSDARQSDESKQTKSKKIFLKIRDLWNRIRSFPERVRGFVTNLHRKSKDLGTMLGEESNRQAVKLIWNELLSLLKRYGPKRVSADVSFGTEDPALTGEILAVLSMMPFLFGSRIAIRPDFNSEKIYVKGTFDIRGRIQACHILYSLFRLYKDQNIKKLLKRFRK